jgi:hypothetical protein
MNILVKKILPCIPLKYISLQHFRQIYPALSNTCTPILTGLHTGLKTIPDTVLQKNVFISEQHPGFIFTFHGKVSTLFFT